MTQDEENISKSPTNEVELEEPVIFSLRLPGQGNFPQDKDSHSNNSNQFSCLRILKILGFYLIGISCFVPLNAILSGLDCFMEFHKDYAPEFVYSNLYFFSNFFVQMIIIFVPPKFNYYNLIQISQGVSIITLILNPILLLKLEASESFIFSCVLVIIQGSASAVLFTCLYSFLSYLENIYITSVVTGHGLSGIILNLARFVSDLMLGLLKETKVDKSRLLVSFFCFYYCAAFLIFINLYIWIKLKDQIDIRKALRKVHPTLVMFDEEVDLEERCLSITSLKDEEFTSINIKNTIEYSEYKKVKDVLLSEPGINIMIMLHGLITFCIYPGILIKFNLFVENKSLSILIVLFIFNIFDIFGRQFPKCFTFRKFRYLFIVICLRVYFIFIFLISQTNKQITNPKFGFLHDEVFISVNIALFAFTNGFVISNSFILIGSDEKLKTPELKSKASPVLSVSLNVGIYLGSALAYLLNYLITIN
jgi:hypothetical protein